MEILKLITRMKNKNCGELNLNNINENVTLSGWVSTVVDKSIVDANAMIAATVGAEDGRYN